MASELVHGALAFATSAHRGQDRRYTAEPYIVHPLEVWRLVRDAGGTDAMQAAALLHDVVEDTDATLDDVARECGTAVAELVEWLTDVAVPADGNRAARAAIDRERLAAAPAEAQTIKLADLIDNAESVARHDPRFARVYMEEKRALLDVLSRGDARLMRIARARLAGWDAGERSGTEGGRDG